MSKFEPGRRVRRRPAAAGFAVAVSVALLAAALAAALGYSVVGSATPSAEASSSRFIPPLNRAADNRPINNAKCYSSQRAVGMPKCRFGKRGARVKVVLTGDSQALHHLPAIKKLANQRGWRFVPLVKMGCPPNAQLVFSNHFGRPYRECKRWHRNLYKRLASIRPDIIITSGSNRNRAVVGGGSKMLPVEGKRNRRLLRQGYVRHLKRLRDGRKLRMVVMQSTPRAPFHAPRCLRRNRHDVERCSFRVTRQERRFADEKRVARRLNNTRLLSVLPAYCKKGRCRSVVRKRVVLRDRVHFTRAFSRMISNRIARGLPRPRR